jgi:hypothetical protein
VGMVASDQLAELDHAELVEAPVHVASACAAATGRTIAPNVVSRNSHVRSSLITPVLTSDPHGIRPPSSNRRTLKLRKTPQYTNAQNFVVLAGESPRRRLGA